MRTKPSPASRSKRTSRAWNAYVKRNATRSRSIRSSRRSRPGSARTGPPGRSEDALLRVVARLVVFLHTAGELSHALGNLVGGGPASDRDPHAILEELRVGIVLRGERVVHVDPVLDRGERARDALPELRHPRRLDARCRELLAERPQLLARALETRPQLAGTTDHVVHRIDEAPLHRLVGDLAQEDDATEAPPGLVVQALDREAQPVGATADPDLHLLELRAAAGREPPGRPSEVREGVTPEQLAEGPPARLALEGEVAPRGSVRG